MLGKIVTFIFSRVLWQFIGVLAICYLIWILGPIIAINQWYPLRSATIRLILITIILVGYILKIIWNKWREHRLNAKLLKEIVKEDAAGSTSLTQDLNDDTMQVLSDRFVEAINILKKSPLTTTTDSKSKILSVFSNEHLYKLPWYVFIGAPGSGKTTALVNSGLNFPIEEKFGRVGFKGVGGTRNCDWWFTDEAVLLDTAGRYTTHESDKVGDEEEWSGFLKLLVKYRKRQPINGIILTISVEELLRFSSDEMEQHAIVLRKRLNELHKSLGIDFPVYVLISKTDLLIGFEEYFANFSNEELKQVWGFTFNYQKVQSGKMDILAEFNKEYEALLSKLYRNLPSIIIAEKNIEKRDKIYLFPQEFSNFKQVLSLFLNKIFTSSNFEYQIKPRGIYFTSGCQIEVDPSALNSEQLSNPFLEQSADYTVANIKNQSRSFFLHNFMTKIVFQESGLAGINLKWVSRFNNLNKIGSICIVSILALLILGWTNSYYNNINYIDYVSTKVSALTGKDKQIRITSPTEIFKIVNFMNKLDDIPNGEDFKYNKPPFSYGLGLYQGYKLYAATNSLYLKTSKDILLPQISRRIEGHLKSADDKNVDYAYESLRAYLMTFDGSHYHSAFLTDWILGNLQAELPTYYTTNDYNKLVRHLKFLVDNVGLVSPFAKDIELIKHNREYIDGYPFYERAYNRAKNKLIKLNNSENTLVSLGGAGITSIFERESGKPINKQGIPGLYSYNGYWNIFNKEINALTKALFNDDKWILEVDHTKTEGFDFEKIIVEIKKLYFKDYIQQWDEFLADIKIIKPKDLLGNIKLTRSISTVNSPLFVFMSNVGLETTLLRKDTKNERSALDVVIDKANEETSSLQWLLGNTGVDSNASNPEENEKLELMVDNHFTKYKEFSKLKDNEAVKAIAALFDDLYTYLIASDVALRTKAPMPKGDVLVKLQAESGRMPEMLNSAVESIVSQSSKSVSNVVHSQLGDDINANLGVFCRRAIVGRYPFSAGSSKEVALGDMARFFGPQQMMDSYFQKNLSSLVDQSGRIWKFKPSTNDNKTELLDAQYLAAFQKADVIKNTFFANPAGGVSFKVMIKPIAMSSEISQFIMDIDGQTITYEHGPQIGQSIVWPSPRGLNNVTINITSDSGMKGLSTSGIWALHKMLSKANLTRGAIPEKMIATFNIGGKKVKLEIISDSIYNPFYLAEMRSFTCPGNK